MTTINYKKVKCPKCGKSYFRVKENNDFNVSFLVFKKKPEPIYKNGELQNPTEAEPIKVRCECLECGCNFRVETHDVFGDYRFIDEDEERKENERRLAESFKVLKKETEKAETELVNCQLKINEASSANVYVEPVFDKIQTTPITWQDGLKEELDEIKERLAKLENKVLGENQ